MISHKESISLKEKQVKEIVDLINNNRTLMIVSIKSLPSKQFQDIKKAIRDVAKVKVAKKNILSRVLKERGDDSILRLEKHIKADCAFVISNEEGYELARILGKKKTPVFAKAGQEAQEDIEVKDGPTDLVPGPAISELGAQGIQVAVENGKISIKAPRVVIRKGGIINSALASLLQKLNIQPMNIGLNPVVVYDIESGKIYTEIKIDEEGFTAELKSSASKSLGFAQKIGYFCKESIGYFLVKANMDGVCLSKLEVNDESEGVKVDEESVDGENSEEKSEVVAEEVKDGAENIQLNKPEDKA